MHLLKNVLNKYTAAMKILWITKGILKSINKKNEKYRRSIRTKNATKKEKL